MNITVSDFESEMNEIEKIQREVEEILLGGFWARLFFMGKARKLHYLAEKKMMDLFSCTLIENL